VTDYLRLIHAIDSSVVRGRDNHDGERRRKSVDTVFEEEEEEEENRCCFISH